MFSAGSSRSWVQFVDVPTVGALFDGVTYGAYVNGSAHQMVHVAVFSEEFSVTENFCNGILGSTIYARFHGHDSSGATEVIFVFDGDT